MRIKARLSGGVLASLALVLLFALMAAPANAQDPDPLAGEETVEEPVEAEVPATNPFDRLDFGDRVVIEADGTVSLTVETDTVDAEELVVEPTPISIAVAGTGRTTNDNSLIPARGGDSTLAAESKAGAGSNLALILAGAGAAAAVAVGALFAVRMRRQNQAELELIEDPLDPLAGEALAGEGHETPGEPAYAGAADAGAYEKGGAAYAQFAEPEYITNAAMAADDEVEGTKLDQIRESMVGLADKGLSDAGHDRLVALKLEAAGSKMRPGEWLVMAIAGTIGAFFGASFVFGFLLGGFAAALVAFGFWTYLSYRQGARQKAFAEALPETLQLLAGSLRGGTSMIQSIQTVADEADQPTSEEFQRIITEIRMGRDLAVSFRDLSSRMGSKDFDWVVTAIEIHREVGGDLASILDRVGDTIRARNRVRGQVKALSAEGRMSGLILFVLPPGMVAAISFLNRGYLDEMLDETSGQIMLIVATVLLLIGGAWLKRLARFVY